MNCIGAIQMKSFWPYLCLVFCSGAIDHAIMCVNVYEQTCTWAEAQDHFGAHCTYCVEHAFNNWVPGWAQMKCSGCCDSNGVPPFLSCIPIASSCWYGLVKEWQLEVLYVRLFRGRAQMLKTGGAHKRKLLTAWSMIHSQTDNESSGPSLTRSPKGDKSKYRAFSFRHDG